MTVTDMARVLQRMWPVIVIITALGVLAGALALVVSTPRYDATARMFVSTQSLGSAQELLQGSTYTQARIGSYAAVATDPIVLEPVIDELGLDVTPDELAGQISTSVERESLIISITVTDASPTAAADIVNAVTTELATVIEDQLESPVAGSQSLVSVSVTREATVPTAPVAPVPWIMITVGFGAGLLLGIGIAFVLAAGDTRIRSVDEIQAITDLPIVGAVALDRGLSPQSIVDRPHQTSRAHEAFRTIRTNLRFMEVDGARQVLLVTSSIPGEGKSVTAITLARTLAEAGDSVILVDADMRLPRMAEYLGIEGSVGLSDALIGRIDRADVVQRLGDVSIIPAGRVPPNPSELLGSQRFVDFIDGLRREYDHVVIDAPPIVPVTDAAVISRAVDGVVVVAAAAHVLNKQLQAALTALERVGAPVLGIIANRLPRRGMDAYAQYGYGYVAEAEAAAEAEADAKSVERRGGRGSKTGPQRASASVD